MEQQGPFSGLCARRAANRRASRGAEGLLPGEEWIQCYEHLQEPYDFDGIGLGCYDLWHAETYGK